MDGTSGLCLGSGRTIDEIARWGGMSRGAAHHHMMLPARKALAETVKAGELWRGEQFCPALAAMLLVSNSQAPPISIATFGYVAFGVALLVFIGGGVLVRYRGQAGAMFRDAVT
jgi:predicted Fe-S protein YdhL (DUF1289 family)